MQNLAKQDLPDQDPPDHLAIHPAHDDPRSAYRSAFRRGATLLPRLLCLVERRATGRPGGDPAAPVVASRRNNQAKEPWKGLAGVEHPVEAEFLRPVLLGENILPFRLLSPPEGVIPVVGSTVLDAQGAADHGFAGLNGWMAAAEAVWDANSSERGEHDVDGPLERSQRTGCAVSACSPARRPGGIRRNSCGLPRSSVSSGHRTWAVLV